LVIGLWVIGVSLVGGPWLYSRPAARVIFRQRQKTLPMRRHRFIPVFLLGCGLVAVTAVVARGPSAPPLPSTGVVEDAEACALLDRAAQALLCDQVTWLSCEIRQEAHLPDLSYTGEGRYLLAPGHRFRLELQTRVGETAGTLLLVGDGVNVWQARRAGSGGWEHVTRLGLAEVLTALEGPGGAARLRAEFLAGPTLSGVAPLLRTLRYRLLWVRHETTRDAATEGIELTGVWRPDDLRQRAPLGHPWPAGLPRQCRVVLDAQTLWPARIEWWGPATPGRAPVAGGSESLLASTEYGKPCLNEALPPEECTRAFSFDAGDAAVTDRTLEVAADLAARLQQMK
jgi:hypothetical protein